MKLTNTQKMTNKRGMTLLELTVVILVLMSLISVLFVGARAWMKSSDRAAAIMIIRNAQQGVRAASASVNVEGNVDGTTWEAMPASAAPLNETVFASDGSGYVKSPGLGLVPTHPANGVAFTFQDNGGTTVPPIGKIYIASGQPAYDPTTEQIAGW